LKGKAYGKLGNQVEKVSLLKIAIELNEKVPAYHRNLGAALYNLKNYPNAVEEHSIAI
jgi:tetratricopeptide (TPR) repeat protein